MNRYSFISGEHKRSPFIYMIPVGSIWRHKVYPETNILITDIVFTESETKYAAKSLIQGQVLEFVVPDGFVLRSPFYEGFILGNFDRVINEQI